MGVAGTRSEILLVAVFEEGCMPVRSATQGHISLGRVFFATMGVMAGCLWPHRGPRRYAGGVSAAWYGCSRRDLLLWDVIGFDCPPRPAP